MFGAYAGVTHAAFYPPPPSPDGKRDVLSLIIIAHARTPPSFPLPPPSSLNTHTHTHSEFLSGNYSDLRMLNPDLPLLMRASVAVEPAIVAHTSESRYAYSRAAIAHTHSHIAPRSRRHPLSLSLSLSLSFVAFRLGCTEAHRPCG
mgnify:CR=1 FL=1